MAALTFATGFEHKVVAASGGTVIAADKRLWATVVGVPTVETTIVHHGTSAIRFAPSGSQVNVTLTPPAGKRRKVYSFYVWFVTLPSVAVFRLVTMTTTAGAYYVGVSTGGKWTASTGGGSAVIDAVGPSAGAWYRVDMDVDIAGGVLNWAIDGTAKTQATGGGAAADITVIRIGQGLTGTGDAVIDCLVESETGADYPLGEYKVLGYKPNADVDITQVGAGAFQDAAAVAISGANPAWDNLLDPGLAAATTRVQQTAIAAAGYIKVGFEDSIEANPPDTVVAIAAVRAASTTLTDAQVQIDDGGTLDPFTGLFDPSEATNVNIFEALPWRLNATTAIISQDTDSSTQLTVFGDSGAGNWERLAQGFTLSTDDVIGAVTLRLIKVNSPADTLILDIVSTKDGTALQSSTAVSSATLVANPGSAITFTFPTPVRLAAGSYFLQLRRTGARDVTNYIQWRYHNTDPYAGGTMWNRDSGTWVETTTGDLRFIVYSAKWTDAAFDALAMRFGYSTDANPDPWFVGLMYEAAFAVVAAAPAGIPILVQQPIARAP